MLPGVVMKRATLLWMLAAAAAFPAWAEGELRGRFAEKSVYLDGGVGNRPPIEHIHEMAGPAREVVLHLSFRKGLFRLSKTGDRKGTFGGLYVEVNDGTRPTDPIQNPYKPIAVQRANNADWMDFVANDFPYPNPEPGYWYTWGRSTEDLKRSLRLDLGARSRYRIRVRGVVDDRREVVRVPTLVGITEVDDAAATEAPREQAAPKAVTGKSELAFPTGDKETSVLWIEREAPISVRPGEKFTYTIRVTNLTDMDVGAVTVVEEGAGRIDLVRSDPPYDGEKEEVVSWRLGTIPARGTKVVTVDAVAQDRAMVQRSCHVRWESALVTQKVAVVR